MPEFKGHAIKSTHLSGLITELAEKEGKGKGFTFKVKKKATWEEAT